jgi:hypothetical protein
MTEWLRRISISPFSGVPSRELLDEELPDLLEIWLELTDRCDAGRDLLKNMLLGRGGALKLAGDTDRAGEGEGARCFCWSLTAARYCVCLSRNLLIPWGERCNCR